MCNVNVKGNISVAEKYTYTSRPGLDEIKIPSAGQKSLIPVLAEVLVDTQSNPTITLGSYYETTLHYLIEAMPVQNYILLECARWLQSVKFKNFSVLKILIRFDQKELIVISDKVNDDVLEEFYSSTFQMAYKNDSDIVFMINTENNIFYSAMPKCDKVIEVAKNE